MPRVKIDYVVSFSSEDPDNQASNLLSWEVDKKRWLCGKWESSCSVVLQLVRAVQISAIHIGAHHAALVEVLVGRSETPNEPFQVLVPSCVFLSPAESRRDAVAVRVRSFTADHLAAAAAQRWDRVRLVCSQPYNKHCKYGLTFVHVYEPEGAPSAPAAAAPAAPSAPAAAAPASPTSSSSSEDEYRPGQLFAASSQPNTDTGAQIRKATSQILKNISDSSKIVKSPIIKNSSKKQNAANDSPGASRDRDILMYTDEDKPHTKIDQVVERHRHEKKEKDASKPNVRDSGESSTKTNLRDGDKKHNKNDSDANENSKRNIQDAHRSKEKESSHSKRETKKRKHDDDDESNTTTHHKTSRDNSSAKRRETDASDKHRPSTKDNNAGAPLAGAGVVFSGYVHPRRGLLQRAAAALGARVLPAWGPAATHLVCAFPDTPKLREVRAQGARGARAPAATGEWLEAMSRAGRALPWRWFASEPRRRRAPPPPGDAAWLPAAPPAATPDDDDTDDEIERVLQQKKARKSESNSPRASPTATSEEGGETEEEQGADSEATWPRSPPAAGAAGAGAAPRGALPDFFDGFTFAFADDVEAKEFDKTLLSRYIQAYGGVIVEMSHMESESDVDYVVCGGAGGEGVQGGGGRRVRADWVWRCHHAQTLLG